MDRAYTNLLGHLQRPSTRIPLQTVFSAVPHYLACLPLPHPTQLTAIVISSSLWKTPSAENVWSLASAFRSAVHLKKVSIEKEATGLFSRSPETLLGEWIQGVMKGVSRGDAQLRVAILGGLLLGLEDLSQNESQVGIRGRVESQIVVACAQVMETLSAARDAWKDEFIARGSGRYEDVNETAFLYSACQILPMVASSRFRALDLSTLIRLSRTVIKNMFLDGAFLNNLELSATRGPSGRIKIPSESILSTTIQNVSKDLLYQTAGPLAKLLSRALSHLAEDSSPDAWRAFQDTSLSLESMACKVERDWKSSALAAVTSDQDIEPQSRGLSNEIWSILKTLLFTHVLVTQAILSEIPYMRPLQTLSSGPTPSSIACSVLRALYHLSFISSRFGGLTSPGDGFKELKRVFYLALDIVADNSDANTGNAFMKDLLAVEDLQGDMKHPYRQAKVAYALAVVEQLVPVLYEPTLEHQVISFCVPYLNDPQNRETYESSHSVVLSIFADHAERTHGSFSTRRPTLAERLVPFYVNSLIENSSEGGLSRAQLKLAYSSLVRSAASSGDDALAWLCVEALISRIRASPSDPTRLMDLFLTLISLISCVPFSQLLTQLEEVEKILALVHGENRKILAEAILEEITNRVGDREREIALSWWCDVASRLVVTEEVAG